ncbi:hypothetical protein BGZ99_006187 [Dissophora globulifera]|uniref:Uncharacterized protein n=1 Tax=Dissophora globulifera TaxID=979702 RepID=A0A9P6RFQ3_9FUNG|nr:hypothetical protein BGZ99_006187 [Dissophora globulifera]
MALWTSLKDELAAEERVLACQEAARLQDDTIGASTLAISSPNNDTLKGFVTLAGSYIVKGELTIKLPKLPVVKVAIHSNVPSNASVPTPSSVAVSIAASTAVSTAASITGTSSSSSSITAGTTEAGNGRHSSEETTPVPLERSTSSNSAPGGGGGGGGVAVNPSQPQSVLGIGSSNQVLQQALQTLPHLQTPVAAATGTTSGTASGAATPPTGVVAGAMVPASGAQLMSAGVPPIPPTNTHQLLHSYRPPGHLTLPYLLEQIKDVQNHTAQAIFRLEDYWSSECNNVILGGDSEGQQQKRRDEDQELDVKGLTRPLKTLLELMQRHLRAGIEAMARPKKEKLYPFRIFSPALSEDFVIEFYVRDSQLVCAAYALQLTGGTSSSNGSGSGGNVITQYLQHALPGGGSHQQVQSSSSTVVDSSDGHHHGAHPVQSPARHSVQSGSGEDDSEAGAKSGQITPRPSSPNSHHHTVASQPSHQPQGREQPSHQSSGGNSNNNSSGGAGRAYLWSPSRSPPTPQQPHHSGSEYHPSTSAVTNPPINEPIVLLSSSKIGQTSKGGINKYRGKVASTIEDKVVQVESPKLAEISARLAHAENLCRRLLHFLILQETVATHPI